MKMRKIIAVIAAVLMLCSILPVAAFAADTYELATSIAAGDVVILACTSAKKELGGISTTSTKYGTGTAYTTAPAGAYVLTVEAGSTSGTYSFKTTDGKYLYWSSGNSLATNATKNANTSWTVTFSGNNAVIKNCKDSSRILQWNNSSPRFACYGNSGQTAVQLFKKAATEPEVPSTCEHEWDNACDTVCNLGCGETREITHAYGEATETVAPDCTNAGEKQSTCSVCGDVKTETVKALGHNYVDGACDVCGEAKPLNATIDFSTKDQRTEYSTTVQKWENDGLTLINNKASSTNNVGDYAAPARFYKSSTITISYEGMTSLVIDASGISSNGDWKATLADYSYTVENNVYTITFANPTDSITLTAAAQVRANSITAYGAAPSDCEHDYVGVETQAPTCSAEGVMTYTCSKCQESYTEAIAVIAHNYVEDVIDSTCTTTGTKTYECSVCFHSYDETIPVKPHNYVDDVCADCGHVKVYKGTIDFSDAEQRTELTTQIQIWVNEGLTFTNNKLTGSNIADYTDPIRIYKNSGIVIEFPEMSKLIIDASGIGNDYLWDATLGAAGLSFTVANGIYTITFAEAKSSLELTCANQVRANSITAIVAHECTYDSVVTDPDCVNGGYTTNTCTKCGDSNVSDATDALGHTYSHEYDAECNTCGAIRTVDMPIVSGGFSASEEINGLAAKFSVSVEGMAIKYDCITQADYTNATIDGNKLINMGAIASNGISSADIEAVYLCELDEDSAAFAARVINIPDDKLDVEITFTPYFIVEIDGTETTIYGESVAKSYNGALGN